MRVGSVTVRAEVTGLVSPPVSSAAELKEVLKTLISRSGRFKLIGELGVDWPRTMLPPAASATVKVTWHDACAAYLEGRGDAEEWFVGQWVGPLKAKCPVRIPSRIDIRATEGNPSGLVADVYEPWCTAAPIEEMYGGYRDLFVTVADGKASLRLTAFNKCLLISSEQHRQADPHHDDAEAVQRDRGPQAGRAVTPPASVVHHD